MGSEGRGDRISRGVAGSSLASSRASPARICSRPKANSGPEAVRERQGIHPQQVAAGSWRENRAEPKRRVQALDAPPGRGLRPHQQQRRGQVARDFPAQIQGVRAGPGGPAVAGEQDEARGGGQGPNLGHGPGQRLASGRLASPFCRWASREGRGETPGPEPEPLGARRIAPRPRQRPGQIRYF